MPTHRSRVFVHGFAQTSASFKRSMELAPANMHSICLEVPGHAAALPVANGWSRNIDLLAGAIEDKGLVGCDYVGYSLGARLGLGLLCEHPNLLGSATLIGVHPGLTTNKQRTERKASDQRWIDVLEDHGIAEFVRRWEAQPLWASQSRLPSELIAGQRAERLRHNPDQLAEALKHMGLASMPNYRGSIAALSTPVTLVAGSLDLKFTALADELITLKPRWTKRVVDDVGHNVVLEAPGALWPARK